MAETGDVVLRSYLTEHPRAQALVDGRVTTDGVRWEWLEPIRGGFRGVSSANADVFEYSLSGYLLDIARHGHEHQDWIALPVFLSRATEVVFKQWSGLDVLGWSGLKGRRFAIPDMTMTAGLWIRAVLRELYDIEPQEIEWFNIRQPDERHSDELGIGFEVLKTEVGQIPRGANLYELVANGELDAFQGNEIDPVLPPNVKLLVDATELRAISNLYMASTGAQLINHVTLVRKSLLAEHPGIDVAIFELIERAKQVVYDDARRHFDAALLFPKAVLQEQEMAYGADPFPSGITANRASISALMNQLVLEGALERPLDDATIFAPGLLDT